jgi:hypothetical protein
MNKFSTYIGFGIYGVNIICGFIFSLGLGLFCKSLPRPLLALSVAMPYLVIVVAMGYSRQAVSLGLCMIGLAYLGRGNLLRFVFFIMIAITIHKSSMILLPLAALAATKNKVSLFISILFLSIIIYIVFLAETFDIIYRNYVEVQQQSSRCIHKVGNECASFNYILSSYIRDLISRSKRRKYGNGFHISQSYYSCYFFLQMQALPLIELLFTPFQFNW